MINRPNILDGGEKEARSRRAELKRVKHTKLGFLLTLIVILIGILNLVGHDIYIIFVEMGYQLVDSK